MGRAVGRSLRRIEGGRRSLGDRLALRPLGECNSRFFPSDPSPSGPHVPRVLPCRGTAGDLILAVRALGEMLGSARKHERRSLMTADAVTARELNDARAAGIGRFLLRLEPQAGLADELALLKTLHLPADYIGTYTVRMNAVTPDQVRQVAKKYLAPESGTIVVAGDASQLQPRLRKFGAFEILRAK